MRHRLYVTLFVIVVGSMLRPAILDAVEPASEFGPPELILDRSGPGGWRMYPSFADIDVDGKIDLLVGVAAEERQESGGRGRLLIYSNRGTNARPMYAKPKWLDESVSSACIPDG